MKISPFELERYFARYEFDVEYTMCSSDCQSMTIAELLSFEPDAADRFGRTWLGYTESPGNPSLRGEISRMYPGLQPGQVLVHTGAEEAIFLFMHATLEAGDHVIAHWPCYQSLVEVARSIGCQVSLWAGQEEQGWALDLDELEGLIQPKTKVIVLNTPHNPTGYLMKKGDFHRVSHLAQENGITLFSDEVYRESEHDESDRLPPACTLGEHAVSLGVMSKSYGLPGLRIGWAATQNQKVLNSMAVLKDYTTICNPAPSEFLAELALRHRERLAMRSVETITRNLALLDAFFERNAESFDWQRPKAGPIAFPRLKAWQVEIFCDQLVKEASVLLLPGTVYGDQENHFRLGFGRSDMSEALERLETFLENR